MRGVVRRSDTVARLGGDEFAIVLGSIARELDAGRVAEKILATLARPMPIGATICSASASIGIATYPSDALDAEALVRSADHAMYQAKQHGRGRYEFFAGALGSRSSERLELERKLHHAVDHERLEARYALETDGTGERVVSLEASVAWRHPEHGLLPPDRTLALAVETREIVPIGGWLVRRALRDLAALREAGRGDLRLSLRVCESQLVAAGFVPLLHDALGEHGVPPDRVELAVGEDVFHGRSELGLRTLEACAALGVRIGWCGAGRAALSPARLAELPGSALALDAALAARLPEDPVACAIAAAVAALARGLGLEAVADGVEGPAQAELLASQGYTRLRGPWLGDPLAADTLPGALRREPAKLGPRGSPD
jgi:predicted signal transduction protein with EAL and GGDEF domain